MRLVEFEAGDPDPATGTITISAKSPEAQKRGDSKYWHNVAFVEPDVPIGQGRTKCAAWIKQNLARITGDLERDYQGETLQLNFADLRATYRND
jgi:hypothetical protein